MTNFIKIHFIHLLGARYVGRAGPGRIMSMMMKKRFIIDALIDGMRGIMTIEELHESLKIFPRISPLLIMRRTKQTFAACVEMCREINKLRDEQGINRKKWARIK